MSATSCAERDCCGCFLGETTGFLLRATGVLRKRIVNAIFYSYSCLDARPSEIKGWKMSMTTLTTTPCADVLARLYAEADASDARLDEWTNSLPAGERAELMAGARDFRQFYGRLKDFYLAVSRATASLLYMLARSCRAKAIVEFGTSFGVSTLHLAAALRDNGGGRLIGTELEATKAAQARENITAAGLGDLV